MQPLKPLKVTHFFFGLVLFGYTMLAQAALDLNGIAVHEELGTEQFIAGLYLESLSSDNKTVLLSDQRKRMEMKILTDRMLSRRFQRLWIEGIAINSDSGDLAKHAQNLADFSNILKIKLIKDDTLTIERTFRRGVDISLNGVLLGNINDVAFFDLLLRTWIGPVPISTQLKTALLQAGSIDPTLLSRFENTRTTSERVAEIQASTKIVLAGGTADTAAKSSSSAASSVQSTSSTALATALAISSAESSSQSSSITVVVSSSKPATQLIGDNVFDEEEEDFSYTAADLLSRQLYVSKLTRWTSAKMSYPRQSLRRNEEGTVRVTVTINRKGEVIDTKITDESAFKALNAAALKAIAKASPYPELPEVISGESFVFTIPFVFALRSN